MKILVLGLGIYGTNLAVDLTDMGNEVIGADNNRQAVDAIKDTISAVYCIDTTEEAQLAVLPLKHIDLVVVCIGENFGASVKTVALLKKMGVAHIYARAIDKLHYSILQAFDLDRILAPEQRAASDLSLELMLGTTLRTLKVDANRYVIQFKAPPFMQGQPYTRSFINDVKGLVIIAATRPRQSNNILGIKSDRLDPVDIAAAGAVIGDNDVLTALVDKRAVRELLRWSRDGRDDAML